MDALVAFWQQLPLWLKWLTGGAGTIILGTIGNVISEHVVSPWTWRLRARWSRRTAEREKKKIEDELKEVEDYRVRKGDLVLRAINHFLVATGLAGLAISLLFLGMFLLSLSATSPSQLLWSLLGTFMILVGFFGGAYFLVREFNRMLDTSVVIRRVLNYTAYRERVNRKLASLNRTLERYVVNPDVKSSSVKTKEDVTTFHERS